MADIKISASQKNTVPVLVNYLWHISSSPDYYTGEP